MRTEGIRLLGVGLVFLGGAVAAATGIWFLVTPQPFTGEGGYADEFGMTEAEVVAFNPRIASWVRHVQDQVGSVSMGWGLFVAVLALTGLRQGASWARWALWIGATPTLVISAFGEIAEFGTVDVGSALSMLVLALFVLGMALTYVRGEAPRRTAA